MYNHEDNAGSVFDIFKHAILLKAVQRKKSIKTYFETHCGFSSYNKGEIWESSWVKVHRIRPVEMILCDTNPDVFHTVPGYKTIAFYNRDGYEERLHHNADLTFIDPPYVLETDWSDVEGLTSNLDERVKQDWIVWYPIFTSAERLELNTSACIEMLWKTNSRMPGCGMAFSKGFTQDLNYIYQCVPFIAWSLSAVEWHFQNKI